MLYNSAHNSTISDAQLSSLDISFILWVVIYFAGRYLIIFNQDVIIRILRKDGNIKYTGGTLLQNESRDNGFGFAQ